MIKKIKNFLFCLRYPFYKQYNVWSGRFVGYEYTDYDCIPEGWRKAFGKEFSKELKIALKKEHRLYTFRFTDIKEKYGTLRLYHNGVGNYSKEVIKKYEDMSTKYCVKCGKPAKYKTYNWIQYLCEDCVKDSNYDKLEEIK